MSINKSYNITEIPSKETYSWLLNKHYAKRIPSISFSYGLYRDNELCGVCTYGKPPSNALCIGVCGGEYSDIVYELNRLCVDDGLEKNVLSFFLSRTLKLLPKPMIIVSYADTAYHHNGYIYQATNWIYTGLSAKRTERYDPNNPNKHSKTVTETMNYYDLAVRDRSRKHRYVMFLGNKRQTKNLIKNLKYSVCNYPKGVNKRYDSSFEPQKQGVLF